MLELNTDRMRAEITDGIGWMTFNNPARHNALSLEMWQAIGEIVAHFEGDEDVRVIVMTGAGGKAFVSGADISEFDKQRANSKQKEEYARISASGSRALATVTKPLIAMVEGYCIGGGLATALAADIRFASPDSSFGIPAAKLGLGYEYAGLAKLARVVGPARARDILFSARFLGAEEAQRAGLVQFISPRDRIRNDVIAYATQIATNAPLTVAAAKAAINAYERGGHIDDVEAVEVLVSACFDSDDYKEGRRAFAEKRTPQFTGH